MRGRPSVWRRTQRLTALHGDAATRIAVRQAAIALGLDDDEVIAEAEHLARIFAQRGLRTDEERIASIANEDGISVEELTAELADVRRTMVRM